MIEESSMIARPTFLRRRRVALSDWALTRMAQRLVSTAMTPMPAETGLMDHVTVAIKTKDDQRGREIAARPPAGRHREIGSILEKILMPGTATATVEREAVTPAEEDQMATHTYPVIEMMMLGGAGTIAIVMIGSTGMGETSGETAAISIHAVAADHRFATDHETVTEVSTGDRNLPKVTTTTMSAGMSGGTATMGLHAAIVDPPCARYQDGISREAMIPSTTMTTTAVIRLCNSGGYSRYRLFTGPSMRVHFSFTSGQ